MPPVQVRRVYDEPSDGQRVLVDRVWPRGVSKADLVGVEWLRDVAPSTELRRWYGHDPAKFTEFRRRYRAELDDNTALEHLRELAAAGELTLLTATRDVEHSHAKVLAGLIASRDGEP